MKFQTNHIRIRVAIILFISLLFHTSSASALYSKQDQTHQPTPPTLTTHQEGPQYAPGEVIVKLKEKETPQLLSTKSYSERKARHASTLSELKRKYKLKDEKPVFKELHSQLSAYNTNLQQVQTQKKSRSLKAQSLKPKVLNDIDLLPIYIVKTDQSVIDACAELNRDPDVEYAEPNYICTVQMIPNDPYYHSSGSWGQGYDDLWGLKQDKLNCESAWDMSQGDGVVVAVIDTGVDYNHVDIAANMWDDGSGNCGHDYVNDDNDAMDDHGHGTHVAGTIAAVGNNNIGIIGVAPMAKIMAVKGFNSEGQGSYAVLAQCIQYAADNGADILSNSWGGLGNSQTLTDAFHYADSLGCICIAAAGNQDVNVSDFTPANIDTVIAVAATDQNDEKCSFSNYGFSTDVSAPGFDILSLRAAGTNMYRDGIHIVDDIYYRASGTSMACPHAAGVAALILSNNPNFNAENIRSALKATSAGISCNVYLGQGRINAYSAANLKITLPTAILTTSGYTKGMVDIMGTAEGEHFKFYALSYGQGENPSTWTDIAVSFIPVDNGVLYPCFDTTQLIDGTYAIRLGIVDDTQEYIVEALCSVTPPWPFKTDGMTVMSPAVADINGDGSLEILVSSSCDGWTSHEGYLYCIDKSGNLVWIYQNNYQIFSSPAVTDINGDGSLEVLIGSCDHYIYCIDSLGNEIWKYPTDGAIFSSPALADINGDGSLEVLVGSCDGYIYCIDNLGKKVWKYQTGNAIFYPSPAIADINGDGSPEVLIGSGDGYLYCIDSLGNLVWKYMIDININQVAWSSPATGDINGDSSLEVLIGSTDGNLYCIDKLGNEIWKYPTGGPIFASPAIADINGDGSPEVLIGSGDGYLYCIDSLGNLVWKYLSGVGIYSSPAVADINGDDSLEVLIGSRNGYLYCIDNLGKEVWKYQTNSDIISSLAVADLNGDGNLEILIGSQNYYLYCVDKDGHNYIPMPIQGKIDPMPWPMFQHDMQHTGYYTPPNSSPNISAIPDSLIKNEGDTITAEEVELATDADGDILTYSYSGWLTSLPYTTSYDDAGKYALYVEVSDGTVSVGKDITIIVNNINTPPKMLYLQNLRNKYLIWLGRDKENGYNIKYSYRIDRCKWSSPSTMRLLSIQNLRLKPGKHLFEVKAIDKEGMESKIKSAVFIK